MKTSSRKHAEARWRESLQRQTRVLGSKQLWSERINRAGRRNRNLGIDITWITDRIGLGGGIWTAANMAEVARAGITHIIDMQVEFDDTPLAEIHGIKELWNTTDVDFQSKSPKPLHLVYDFTQLA